MAKIIKGPVYMSWEQTHKEAEIILRREFKMFNITVTGDLMVYTTKGQFLDEEIGMLIMVSDTQWVFRPKSEY